MALSPESGQRTFISNSNYQGRAGGNSFGFCFFILSQKPMGKGRKLYVIDNSHFLLNSSEEFIANLILHFGAIVLLHEFFGFVVSGFVVTFIYMLF